MFVLVVKESPNLIPLVSLDPFPLKVALQVIVLQTHIQVLFQYDVGVCLMDPPFQSNRSRQHPSSGEKNVNFPSNASTVTQ